ncbi:MAG TPA: efflux RND transporter periplasmic adaptor subunit [Bacteroidota bacterium]|nr:efflux RND transporter periplasmic adaptor subunit [Bacteroidota bacterium]
MKRRVVIVSGAGVLVLAVLAYFLFGRSTNPKYDFRLDKVSKGSIAVVVSATGTVNPVISVDVGTQVSGIVSRLYADYNSIVKEGEVIAQIDSTFLSQAVRDAEASLEKTRAQIEQSRRAYFRMRDLFQRQLESQADYDVAYTTYLSDSASVKSAEAALVRTKINLAYATIYAPINGVVINRAVNVGQTVAASLSSPTLYTIANDLHKMQVQTVVDESDIGAVSIGQTATFTVDAYPDEKFSGTVSKIWLVPQSISNVVNYTVIIDVNNDQLKLMPGMTANVKIMVASDPDALRVPNMALRFQPPAELVDSAQMQSQRAAFFAANGGPGADPAGGGKTDGMKGAAGGQHQFQAIRDSILAAHGGQMDQDDLRNEVRAAIQARGGGQPVAAEEKVVPAPKAQGSTKYGVTQRFPEYQKSGSDAVQRTGTGRIWVLNDKGKLMPVFVRTGLNDGRFTVINSTSLKPGDQVVLGANSNSDATTNQTTNPLSGQGQRSPVGGFR